MAEGERISNQAKNKQKHPGSKQPLQISKSLSIICYGLLSHMFAFLNLMKSVNIQAILSCLAQMYFVHIVTKNICSSKSQP